MSNGKRSLYERLGGYDAITAVANDLLPRLRGDSQLGRFWAHRGDDGIDHDLLLHIQEAVENLRQRDPLHVRAEIARPGELDVRQLGLDIVGH